MKIVKVFICQPMSGMKKSVVMMERRMIEENLRSLVSKDVKVKIIDNYTHAEAPVNAGRLWHLGRSIQQLEEADVMVFAPGWWRARGCRVEKLIQIIYKIPCINIKKEIRKR